MRVVQLLSDLGYNDTGVAKVKGAIGQLLPDSSIIDVTHNIHPFYLQQAAYLLASSVINTVPVCYTIAFFDLYYTQSPVIVAAKIDEQIVFAPDNGIIPIAFPGKEIECRRCAILNDNSNLVSISKEIAAFISMVEENSFADTGEAYELSNISLHTQPNIYDDYIECYVVYIDNFENVILNITKDEFETAAAGREFTIHFIRNESITTLSKHYNDVKAGSKLCRFNSKGYLEIAVRGGNAAGLFGFKPVEERQKGYDTIKISFNDNKDSENDFFK